MAKWEELAASKRKQLADSIPPEWRIPSEKLPPDSQLDVSSWPDTSGFFTPEELEITDLTASELLPKLASGHYTSEQVTLAFCKRASVAQQLTNCLSETLFPLASKTAKERDALRQSGAPLGPLHGLPISLKDNFQLTGVDSTDGFVSWINQPATYNSAIVDLLLSLGAVPYVKTNVPTAMMIAETVNNVFGRTVNPRNRKLTSGGSSGGESALIVMKGSCLGVGTDIGGSLRIPAACTGIYTVRPSAGRFPIAGAKSGLAGQEAVRSVLGPMARSLEDVELWAREVVRSEPWRVDPTVVPIAWREVEVKGTLKIGVMWDDGLIVPTPPVKRALKETVEKLRNAGHEVVDWAPEGHTEIYQMLGKFFVADGGKTLKSILEPVGEPFRPELAMYEQATEIGVSELWKMQSKRVQLIAEYLKRWQRAGIDAILCPTTPYATVEHGNFKSVGYTGVFNVLDYSASSFPSGLYADEKLDHYQDEPILSELDTQTRKDYNAAAVHGMPISLQLVAQRLEEEKVLAMTREVLKVL
ncbi:Acetamidase-like protein 1 [Elsinoe fawcettii]|nr:Acetamidase-like protein 1 [Elsinoe fawcettii]